MKEESNLVKNNSALMNRTFLLGLILVGCNSYLLYNRWDMDIIPGFWYHVRHWVFMLAFFLGLLNGVNKITITTI